MSTKDIPGWVQAVGFLLASLVGVTIAYAGVKSDLRDEATIRASEVKSLQDSDVRQEKSIDKIEQMLREELERHHPRTH